MTKYLVTVHYNLKANVEEKVVNLLEKEIFPLLLENKCYEVELFQDESNPSHFFYEAHWNSLEDARSIQKQWDEKALPLKNLCTNTPQREFFKVRSAHTEKNKKAA